MSFALAYWVLMLVSLVGGTWSQWPPGRMAAAWWMTWLLLLLLGWSVYGSPLHE